MDYTKDKKSHKVLIAGAISVLVFISIDVVLITNFIHILSLV